MPAIDPVCGMAVDPATTPYRHDRGGTTYYFCRDGCLSRFRAEPERFLGAAQQAPKAAVGGAQYTCPMHPEIVRNEPGACPKCGVNSLGYPRRASHLKSTCRIGRRT